MPFTSTTTFPAIDLVPKKETGAYDFVSKYPEYNGKNVLIGILDTGIDPGASGMQFLPDGKTPKLLDIIDCTGSGDVDISTERSVKIVDENTYEVETLTGQKVKLNRNWWKSMKPPPSERSSETSKGADATQPSPTSETGSSGTKPDPDKEALPKVKLGMKLAYELMPASVVNRVKQHRKREFEISVAGYVAEIRSKLATLQEDGSETSVKSSSSDNRKDANGTNPTPDQIQKQKDDLTARLEILNDKEWNNDDPGLILDCIVFWDGEDYRAIITESSCCNGNDQSSSTVAQNLKNVKPLAAFRKDRQYGTISIVDQYNYGVNFYDNASVLSIVGDCTPHGTHVAAIASAADGGERNGVAPGAQLISMKIGDSRLSSMETGSSLCRGIITAINMGCDVINLSYGEGSQLPNVGRVIKCAEELVWRYNIMFVSAVGNNGPALSTVNAPGGMSSCIFGVAAYVSPDMMKADYSLMSNTENDDTVNGGECDDDNNDDALVGTTYTWSSVGPAADGSNGVCVCAPGGAITSVSNWTMQKTMLMNGTSMASPHACGCVALLVSACKAKNIAISPPRIQRAIENTAMPMPNLECYQQGWGMIQVEQAMEYLESMKDYDTEDICFDVTTDVNKRGIYLRQPEEVSAKQSFSIRVNANFQRMDPPPEKLQKMKINFEMKFNVKSTAPWVLVPPHFMLMNNGRSFKISLDPTKLPPGVHTATVCGYDAEQQGSEQHQRGVLWSLPITVVKPLSSEIRSSIPLGMLEVSLFRTR